MPPPQPCQIWAASVTYTIAQSNTGSLTYRARPGIEPATSWFRRQGYYEHLYSVRMFVSLLLSVLQYFLSKKVIVLFESSAGGGKKKKEQVCHLNCEPIPPARPLWKPEKPPPLPIRSRRHVPLPRFLDTPRQILYQTLTLKPWEVTPLQIPALH